MTPSNRFLKINLLAIIGLIMISGASASAEIELDQPKNDHIIWLNSDEAGTSGERTFSANLFCTGDFTNPVKIEIRKRGSIWEKREDSSSISYTFPKDDPTGPYEVRGVCKNPETGKNKTDSKRFYVSKMKFEILKPTYNDNIYRRHFMGSEELGDLYKGDPVIIDINLTGNPPQYSPQNRDFSFNIKISNYDNPSGGLDYNFEIKKNEKGDYRAIVHPFIPKNVPGGHHQIYISPLKYESERDGTFTRSLSTSDRATYLPGVRASKILPAKDILYGNVGDIKLELFVEPYYRKYQVSEDDFQLEIDDQSYNGVFNLKKNSDKPGYYTLTLDTVPELPTEKEKFDIDINFKDSAKESAEQFIEIASYDVTSKVNFEGYVRNSKKQPIDTKFKISTEDQYVQFTTLSNGFFSKKFEPGNKTANIKFFKGGEMKGSLNLRNVVMKPKYESKIRFEYKKNPGSIGVEGIEPINLMAVVFGHPFQKEGSTATMKFDSAGVDFTDVNVFECAKWNFPGQSCLSGWKKIPEGEVSRNPAQYRLKFPINPLETEYFKAEKKILTNAYVIGTRASLQIQNPSLNTVDGRIKIGEDLKVSGTVSSTASTSVENAQVNITLLRKGEPVKSYGTRTDKGSFRIKADIPDKPANYSLKITAQKSPFKQFSTTRDQKIWVYRTEGLELERTDKTQPTITIGQTSEITLNLQNTGRTDIQDIKFSENNLAEYISFPDSPIEILPKTESREINMEVKIPEDYSGETLPNVKVTAEGEGKKYDTVKDSVEFTFVINNTKTQTSKTDTKESQTNNKSNKGMSLSNVPGAEATGEFLASQSTLNVALGLIMVFLMVLAGALKRKDDSGNQGVRRNVVGQVNNGNQGRGQVQRGKSVQPPKVSPQKEREEGEQGKSEKEEDEDAEVDDKVDKMAEAMNPEDDEADERTEESSINSVECSVCGESFDTEAAVKMHKKVSH